MNDFQRLHLCSFVESKMLRIVDRKNRLWHFEMHRVCGPVVVDRRTEDPIDNQPSGSSPFWEAVDLWLAQGKRVKDGDLCVWQKPTLPKMKHLGGRHYLLVAD